MLSIRNFHEKKEKTIYKLTNITFIVCLTILLIFGSLVLSNKLRRDISAESFYTLGTVATESSKTITEMLQSRVDYLNSVWLLLKEESEDSRRKRIQNQQSRSSIYNFEWIGYIDLTGKGWNSIGLDVDLSDHPLFHEIMSGSICIAQTPVKSPDGCRWNGIILGIPIYENEDAPAGFLYQVFSPKGIAALLDIGAFDGQARFCLLEREGNIVATSENCIFTIGENIFTRLLESSADNFVFSDNLAEALLNSQDGGGYYTLMGEGWFSYYLPIVLQSNGSHISISMLSTLSENIVEARIDNILKSVLLLLILVLSYVTLVILFFLRIHRRQKQELERLAYQDPLFTELDGLGKIVARVSDDQFIFFFPGMTEEEAPAKCMELKEQILGKLRKIYVNQSNPAFGYCVVNDGETIERLRGRAMFAKSLAKLERTLYHAYDEKAAIELTNTVLLLDEFDRTLERSGVEVWYQPKYDIHGKCIGGAEALARWRAKDGQIISPGRFVPLLEERGKIAALDEYVFTKVCLQQKKWIEEGLPVVPVSVNISRGSLLTSDIVHRYQQILESTGIDQSCIYLEITEDSVHADVVKIIKAFRQEGFHMPIFAVTCSMELNLIKA